jgi:hypothetical protein
MNRWQRLLDRFREFNATQIEFRERQLLRNRPWEEQFLHWNFDGHSWQLHGQLTPPPGRPRSTTSRGWCPAACQYEPHRQNNSDTISK